jgi:DMSO reductase family type II enzyme chaperone
MSTELRTDAMKAANLALARSAIYRLLSQGFVYPTEGATLSLSEEDLPLALATKAPLPNGVLRALSDVATALTEVGPAGLEGAYRDVFSHVHSVDCPTYETDYTTSDLWRQTRELADLGGFYRAFDMEERGERPDHVSVELEFMHLVSYKRSWALVSSDADGAVVCERAEESFLQDHVLRWVPGFADRVAALGGRGPYGALAALAREFLQAEAIAFGLEIPPESRPVAVSPDARAVEETGLCEGQT